MADLTTAPALSLFPADDLAAVEADHPALPPLARTRPPAYALPLPAPVPTRKAKARTLATDRTLSMFGEDETPVVEAPPTPAPSRVYTRQATLRQFAQAPAQLALTPALDRDTGHDEAFEREWAAKHGLTESKPRRHLRLVRDTAAPACPEDTSACPHGQCRKHLGAVREVRGLSFACSVTVAQTFGDLTDAEVAHLAGESEAFVQSTWMTFVRRNPVVSAWLWALVYDHAPELRSYVRPEWFDADLLTPGSRARRMRRWRQRPVRRIRRAG